MLFRSICSGIEALPDPPDPMRKPVRIGCGNSDSVSPFTGDACFTNGKPMDGFYRITPMKFDLGDASRKPAPPEVYHHGRSGESFEYAVSNLQPSSRHLLRLHFCEFMLDGPDMRLFDVHIKGEKERVLKRFDVYREAKGSHKALVKEFPAESDRNGQIVIHFNGYQTAPVTCSGLEVLPAHFGPRERLSIRCGGTGKGIGAFEPDNYVEGGLVESTAHPIVLRGVVHAAPEAVYQACRTGDFTYRIPGFRPDRQCLIRLHFAETRHFLVNNRSFDVTINERKVLNQIEIFKETGEPYKALVKEFTVAADHAGFITISFEAHTTLYTHQAICSGIEILPIP